MHPTSALAVLVLAFAPSLSAQDPSILDEGVRTYEYIVQGEPLGQVEYRLVLDGSDWVSTATTTAAGSVQQTELRFDASDFTPGSLRQTRSEGPAGIAMELEVVDGVLRGSVDLPPRFGAPRTYDEALEPGTLLPGMEEYALALASLETGATIELPYLDVTAGETVQLRAHVVGVETIELQSGIHTAWRVEIQGGSAPATLYLEQSPPHHMLRQDFEGRPVRLERIEG